ncbi:MAG: hypothetical protein IPN68_17870 [Bacteroidetes bacterium]|nr:hypothetical protein [Bacteroidota bacterium]
MKNEKFKIGCCLDLPGFRNLASLLVILVVGLLVPEWLMGQAISLKQIKKAPDSLMTIYTDAQGYQTYRYLRDVAGEVDSVFAKTDSICYVVKSDTTCFYFSSGSNPPDSTIVIEGWGMDVTESPANTYTAKVDTSLVPTNFDISQLDLTLWDSLYNGNRVISRVPAAGNNLQATTFREWINWWYTASYTQPTLTLNGLASPVQVGTSTSYTLSGSTSNPCSFTLSNGTVNGNNFGANTSFSYSYTHAPTSAGTTTITASQDWSETGSICENGSPDSGTKTSSRSITNVYPIFFFMSPTSYTSGSVPYISTPDNGTSVKTPIYTDFIRIPAGTTESGQNYIEFTGTNEYMYVLFPENWSNTLTIKDHNLFNVTSSFTRYSVTVTSTGLANNWTQNYDCWKLNNLTTADNFNYTITFP